jgi:outer membrane protein OmpA-like peptidoglycan-associated protein
MKSMPIMGALLAGIMLAGCGGAPPAVVAVVHQAPPCHDQWVHMPMLVTFPTSGSELDFQNREILREMVRTASTRTDIRRVRVEGHTDTCGSEINNMALSQTRASRVASELVTMGVPSEMIDTMGYGSSRPRANESCGRNQQLSEQTNRRVEFELLVCR